MMLQTLRNLFVRLLDGPLEVNVPAAEGEKPADDTFKKDSMHRTHRTHRMLAREVALPKSVGPETNSRPTWGGCMSGSGSEAVARGV